MCAAEVLRSWTTPDDVVESVGDIPAGEEEGGAATESASADSDVSVSEFDKVSPLPLAVAVASAGSCTSPGFDTFPSGPIKGAGELPLGQREKDRCCSPASVALLDAGLHRGGCAADSKADVEEGAFGGVQVWGQPGANRPQHLGFPWNRSRARLTLIDRCCVLLDSLLATPMPLGWWSVNEDRAQGGGSIKCTDACSPWTMAALQEDEGRRSGRCSACFRCCTQQPRRAPRKHACLPGRVGTLERCARTLG